MYDVIIIGSGPAGYTAAMYASRAFLKTVVFAGVQLGGQLTTTTEVDNFPGFPRGITGPQLVIEMKAQAERFGAEIRMEAVSKVEEITEQPFAAHPTGAEKEKTKKLFRVTTEKGTYETRSVIVATGASAKRLGIPSEETFRGKGISYCATCDGFFFRGKTVAVFGGGDTAMEEATFLSKFASKVTVIHRRDTFRASAIMLERARKDPKISFLVNKETLEFTGASVLSGVKLRDTVTGELTEYPVHGAFVAIGHQPSTGFLKGFLTVDEKGYVTVTRSTSPMDPQTRTSVEGVFAAGDCVDPRYRQAIAAAGMGCQAAIDAERWLEESV